MSPLLRFQGSHALHWPLVLSPGTLVERLGRRELEAKRLEDDRRWAARIRKQDVILAIRVPCNQAWVANILQAAVFPAPLPQRTAAEGAAGLQHGRGAGGGAAGPSGGATEMRAQSRTMATCLGR